MTPAAPSRAADRSLRHHLATLALALALPVVVFVGVLLWRFAAVEQNRLEGQALATARAVSVAIDRELAGLVSTVEIVALFNSLQIGDVEAFHRQALAVRERTGINIVLRDAAGQQPVHGPQGAQRAPGGGGGAAHAAVASMRRRIGSASISLA